MYIFDPTITREEVIRKIWQERAIICLLCAFVETMLVLLILKIVRRKTKRG